MKAALLRFFIKFARHFSRCGGVVDKDCVLFHGGKGAICANGDGAQIVVIADHKQRRNLRFLRHLAGVAA